MKRSAIHATGFLIVGLALAAVAASRFVAMWKVEPIYPSSFVTKTAKLSDYHAPLKGTSGDTDIYEFDSGKPGGTLLICGGTHPNEPAGFLSALLIAENLKVETGRVFVIPRSNNAGFQHNDSQEAMLEYYHIQTGSGARKFRNGSRFTNPVRQWPDPSIYINPHGSHWEENQKEYPSFAVNNPGPGGQMLSGVDSRNLNRVYPGDPNGTLTEQIGYAIVHLIREEKVDLAIDYHEASPEYPTINVMVAHQRAEEIATTAELLLSDDEILITTDSSSIRLRGLSHREWGDATDALAVLFESANPAQGRLKGRTTEAQILEGRDGAYYRAQLIQDELNEKLRDRAEEAAAKGKEVVERSRKILYVKIPKEGVPIEVRVGRHVTAMRRVVDAYNFEHMDREINLSGLPEYHDLIEHGVGSYLHGPDGQAPAISVQEAK